MNKQYNHKNYIINKAKGTVITCYTEDTSYGFRHLAILQEGVRTIAQAKACYYNRTWEQYDYESVIHALIDRSSIRNKKATKKRIDNKALGHVTDNLKMISNVMALGDLFSTDQKESNDWKARMLKAGLSNKGLIMPDDWDQLSEDDKTLRLNGAIAALGE